MNVFQEQSLALCSGQPLVGGQPRGESSKTNSAMEPIPIHTLQTSTAATIRRLLCHLANRRQQCRPGGVTVIVSIAVNPFRSTIFQRSCP